jgi:hypothetical protein
VEVEGTMDGNLRSNFDKDGTYGALGYGFDDWLLYFYFILFFSYFELAELSLPSRETGMGIHFLACKHIFTSKLCILASTDT